MITAELRAEGLHIDGYVNVPGRVSSPVMTPRGQCVELIEQRAFGESIARAGEIKMLLDHNKSRVLASTGNGTLSLEEDAVGLRARSVVNDPEVIQAARDGKIRGWSFGFRNAKDTVEERADGIPLRRINRLDLFEVSLIVNKIPIYSSTSVEVRANEGEEVSEYRSDGDSMNFVDMTPKTPDSEAPKTDYHKAYADRIDKLKIQ